jgi:hypothetical protein
MNHFFAKLAVRWLGRRGETDDISSISRVPYGARRRMILAVKERLRRSGRRPLNHNNPSPK